MAKGPVAEEVEVAELEDCEVDDREVDDGLEDWVVCIATEELPLVEDVVWLAVVEALGATVAPRAIMTTKITTMIMPTLVIVPIAWRGVLTTIFLLRHPRSRT